MTKSLTWLAILLAMACAAAPRPPTPTAPAETPPVAVAPPALIRLAVGGLPGGTPHMWGSRSFELRRSTRGVEVRIHDQHQFQGYGMKPHEMPPTRHVCSRWELLPPDVMLAPPARDRTCADDAATCTAIEGWLKSTAPDRPASDPIPSTTFGRRQVTC
ncbi:MAG: hypothetical protein KIT31_38350 [Deltaproteobacteria bacterium]|nr:hypothetical protein [Deltaproteobacteria bacterium]